MTVSCSRETSYDFMFHQIVLGKDQESCLQDGVGWEGVRDCIMDYSPWIRCLISIRAIERQYMYIYLSIKYRYQVATTYCAHFSGSQRGPTRPRSAFPSPFSCIRCSQMSNTPTVQILLYIFPYSSLLWTWISERRAEPWLKLWHPKLLDSCWELFPRSCYIHAFWLYFQLEWCVLSVDSSAQGK